MTTSCVVAFGSSAPRSICTQPSAAALRLKQAFEARLASYLTGRHSGCFFTAAAAPYYSCFIDTSHGPRPQISVYKSRPCNRGVTQSRRAASAHASVLRHTKSSFTRVTHARRQQNSLTNKDTVFKNGQPISTKVLKSPNTTTVPDGHNVESNRTSEGLSASLSCLLPPHTKTLFSLKRSIICHACRLLYLSYMLLYMFSFHSFMR